MKNTVSRKAPRTSTGLLPLSAFIILVSVGVAVAQSPSASPTPADKRGIGIQSSGSAATTLTDQQAKEAKPELVLQAGYNDLIAATRLVFSPDGKLLATATYRSTTIKLWETATTRNLRDLSTGSQSAAAFAPAVAFSDGKKILFWCALGGGV